MDPLTHAVLGAGIAHALFHRRLGRSAWAVGAVAGVLPDIDGFFPVSDDPLAYLEYHRHCTHALLFVPVGGLVAALPWLLREPCRAAGGMPDSGAAG